MNLTKLTDKYMKQRRIITHILYVVKLSRLNYFYFDDCTQIYTKSSFHTICFFYAYSDGDISSSVYDEICRPACRKGA